MASITKALLTILLVMAVSAEDVRFLYNIKSNQQQCFSQQLTEAQQGK